MSFYDNRYYYLNKLFLRISGHWPYTSMRNVMCAIAIFCLGSMTGLELWGLIAGLPDLQIFIENTSPLLVNSIVIAKAVNFRFNKNKMRDLLDSIEETWKVIPAGPEKDILYYYAEQSKAMSIAYAVILEVAAFFYCTMPIIVSWTCTLLPMNITYTSRFLYRMEHVIDMDKFFTVMMIHGTICVMNTVIIAIGIDGMFVVCVQHIHGLFKIIRYKLERIQDLKFETLRPNMADDEEYHTIIDCIKSYNRILKFSKLLESAYGMSYLVVIGIDIICLSFSAAELIMADMQLDEIIRIVIANVAQLVHIYYISLICQELIDCSEAFHDAIYNYKWYKISLRSRQLLNLTLLRTLKPCQIKAGNLYVMSMENFSSIIQVSMSYFTMLTSLQ